MNFFVPLWTSNGKYVAPELYEDIVRQRYSIVKFGQFTYQDTENMSPLERKYILKFIEEDLQNKADILDKLKNQRH